MTGTRVTDPSLLSQLNADTPQKVTDPALLQQLAGGPDQTNWGERLWRGVRDVGEGAAQIGIRMPMPVLNQSKKEALQQRTDAEVADSNREYTERRGENAQNFDVMRTVGNVAASLPLAAAVPPGTGFVPQVLSGLTAGAITGAAQPVAENQENFWGEKAAQTGTGAGLGGVTGAASSLIGRVISPHTTPDVRALKDAGVTNLTAGQSANGFVQGLETKAANIPFVGDIVRAGQSRALADYNLATLNEQLLKPIGKTLPKGMEAGNDALAAAKGMIDDAYREAFKASATKVTPEFGKALTLVREEATDLLPSAKLEQFEKIGQKIFKDNFRVRPGADLSGEQLNAARDAFFKRSREFANSTDPDQRAMGEMFGKVADSIKDLARNSTDEAKRLFSAADTAYSRYLPIEEAVAASRVTGVFSPQQLLNAAKKEAGTRRFAQGDAPLQEWAQTGARVLGPNAPAESSMTKMVGGVGMLGAPFFLSQPGVAVGGLGAAAMYSPAIQRALSYAITERPEYAKALADALRRSTPMISGASSPIGSP